jgi:hypothetical protein
MLESLFPLVEPQYFDSTVVVSVGPYKIYHCLDTDEYVTVHNFTWKSDVTKCHAVVDPDKSKIHSFFHASYCL